MDASPAYYHRPPQSGGGGGGGSSGSSKAKNAKDGRALLDLLRSRDKLVGRRKALSSSAAAGDANERERRDDDDDDDDDDGNNQREIAQLEDELLSRLRLLGASVRRRGLFPDAERARSYFDRASERSSSASASNETEGAAGGGGAGGGGGSSKKRKRRKGGAGGGGGNAGTGPSAASFGIHLHSRSSSEFSAPSGGGDGGRDLDEGLVLTAICRLLGVTVGRRKKDEADAPRTRSGASHELMCAALDVLSSLCDHARDGMSVSSVDGALCASIEGDMVGSVGTPLLDALRDNILFLYHTGSDGGRDALEGLAGCFKACASAASLLETRLSRAGKTLQGLREATWLVLNNLRGMSGGREELLMVRRAATSLLAALALAGDSEGAPPSKLWSRSVADGIALLRLAIHDFFPMPTLDEPSAKGGGKGDNDPNLQKEHGEWLSVAKEAPAPEDEEIDLGKDPTDRNRSKALQSRIKCLVDYIISLLTMEGYPPRRFALLLPLDPLLDAAEVLLSFPLAAEATRRSTKPRLRSTPAKDGLISPDAAVEISADVRACGHSLLDAVVESSRGSGALAGRARRLMGMVSANLRSSCSAKLVSVVVDGGRGGGGSGAGSWLRGSIPLRTLSVRSFHSVALSLGSGVMSSTGTAKSTSMSLVLLGGCLLEQVAPGGAGDFSSGVDDDDEWGTLGERAKLVEMSSCALAACISAFGGLIPNDVRGTLDSITQTCLSTLYSHRGSSIFAYSHVKRSILQLGMNCVCVPWGDGGRGTVTETVRTVSTMLRTDSNLSVASMALATLCALDAFSTPRAPPILILTRGSVDGQTANIGGSMTASSLLQGMNEAKMEIVASKSAKEERGRVKKKADKSNKRAKKQDETKNSETKSPPSLKKGEKLNLDERSEAAKGTAAKEPPPAAGQAGKSVNESASGKPDKAESVRHDNEESMAEEGIELPMGATAEIVSGGEPPQNAKSSDSSKTTVAELTSTSVDDQDGANDKGSDEDEEMNEENDDDDNSLDDFPDIIDEDPDEEDRV